MSLFSKVVSNINRHNQKVIETAQKVIELKGTLYIVTPLGRNGQVMRKLI